MRARFESDFSAILSLIPPNFSLFIVAKIQAVNTPQYV